jgi:hypothetical protein
MWVPRASTPSSAQPKKKLWRTIAPELVKKQGPRMDPEAFSSRSSSLAKHRCFGKARVQRTEGKFGSPVLHDDVGK